MKPLLILTRRRHEILVAELPDGREIVFKFLDWSRHRVRFEIQAPADVRFPKEREPRPIAEKVKP